MNLYYMVLNILRMFLLLVGSAVIFVGITRAVLEALRIRSGRLVATWISDHIALGLEFFIGATILNLILNPTWVAIQTTALTIIVRKLITISFNRLAQRG
jgi:uncharacterized membrane protein